MSAEQPRIAVVNSNDEIVLSLRDLFEDAGFRVATGHLFDFRTAKSDFVDFLKQWDPEAIVIDIAPPYDRSWAFFENVRTIEAMKGRGVVVTTTNKAQLTKVAGPTNAIEILGKPEDMHQILDAVKRALARGRAAA